MAQRMPSGDAPRRREAQAGGSYTVRVFSVRKRQRKRGPAYEVRWQVDTLRHGKTFATRALADSFRATLLAAARGGERFDATTGLPVTTAPPPARELVSWWQWMIIYTDLKWPNLAPSSRRSTAEALASVTGAMLAKREGAPSAEQLSAVVRGWAGNAARRANDEPDREWVTAIRWLEKNTVDLSALEDPKIARAVLDALALRMDGRPAAPTTIARKRAVLHNAFELAVERELLERNPLDRIRWKAPKVADAIDPRSVINPQQARALLDAVAAQPTGRRLVAFFGCLYYSAVRPSEALALRREDLHLPDTGDGWGELLISRSNPQVSTAWTDHGLRRPRQLKHRARGEVRRVPVPPQLVVLLRAHLAEFCADGSPRVFRGAQHAEVQQATYAMVWRRARKAALSATEYESSLGRRPYDLRHAAVSTWLAAGVDSIQVAAWAGHSVTVLHRVYAHVIHGGEEQAKQRVQDWLQGK